MKAKVMLVKFILGTLIFIVSISTLSWSQTFAGMSMQAGCESLGSNEQPASDGSAQNMNTFHQVNFDTPFPSGSKVIVIPMVQTFNGADTPGLRLTKVDHQGFKIRMNEVVMNRARQSSDGWHHVEEVCWVAISN